MENTYDSGYSEYSDCSSLSSSCSRSPPTSENMDIVFIWSIGPIIQPVEYVYPKINDKNDKIDTIDRISRTPVRLTTSQPHMGRLVKWSLPPPIAPTMLMPGWLPMP